MSIKYSVTELDIMGYSLIKIDLSTIKTPEEKFCYFCNRNHGEEVYFDFKDWFTVCPDCKDNQYDNDQIESKHTYRMKI